MLGCVQGARTVLVITKGFKDLLQIGTQSRPNIFDLKIQKPEQLYEAVVEASERVHVLSRELRAQPDLGYFGAHVPIERGVTGEEVRVLVPLDQEQVRRDLTEQWQKGIRSVAVILLHSYGSESPCRLRLPCTPMPCSHSLSTQTRFASCQGWASMGQHRASIGQHRACLNQRRAFAGTRLCGTSRQ